MTAAIGKTFRLFAVLILLLTSCADSNKPQAVDGSEATSEPAGEATSISQPTATSAPTATPISIAAAAAMETGEELPVSPEIFLGELETYQVESTGLTFNYPAGWIVTEDLPDSILIESEAGYGERFTTDAGAVIVILPMAADDMSGQGSIGKLAAFITANGMPSTAKLGDPITTMLNDQELTFAVFVDPDAGLEGVYAAYLAGDKLAVIVAITGGEDRASYRPAVEEIVDSLILPQSESGGNG
jgi:hypothetical protein